MMHTRTRVATLLALLLTICAAAPALWAATWVNGFVPDWNQPYNYIAPNGPGPRPVGNAPLTWDAWCAPTSASNLAGHWQDAKGWPVADGVAFPGTTAWGQPSWHDYNADLNRPGAGTTDIGWYMDTNNSGANLGNGPHTGTYVKDIHVGLGTFLNKMMPNSWAVRTQGVGFAGSTDPINYPALQQPAALGWAEIVQEINQKRTLITSWTYWNPVPTAVQLNPVGGGESSVGGLYCVWGSNAGDPYNHEYWNGLEDGYGLGHAVTVVGYIPQNDADDIGPQVGLGPTDWVIVHDNWGITARNVVIPFNANTWVANTTAVPEPGTLVLLGSLALCLLGYGWRRCRRQEE